MRKFWRDVVNFFVEALGEEPALVPLRSTSDVQVRHRLQHLDRR